MGRFAADSSNDGSAQKPPDCNGLDAAPPAGISSSTGGAGGAEPCKAIARAHSLQHTGSRNPPLLPLEEGEGRAEGGGDVRDDGAPPDLGGEGLAQVLDGFALAPREKQVLRGIWSCHKRSKIAADLGIAISTVDSYWIEARRKIAVATYNEARKFIDSRLADLRQAAAVKQAVQAATEPLRTQIADRERTIADLQQRMKELEQDTKSKA